ncbi:glycosyltransferase family 2 protein [Microbacterium sp.]|uniref:glycosyltransferase family 2 protein n=1 Tax=Microbacterium sp. TaxID=51671 RepID=UPI003A854010
MLKVSVVIPTYASGEGLDRVVASLDAQTLPPADFEVIFVDDGSPDDTFERLQAIAAERPHVRVQQIENSGWPCRPRNVGTDMARGEYVAYMDHDDPLYPDALRAAYEYAHAHGADVLNGKEARTHDAEWGIGTYEQDVPNSIGRTDQHPLIPMNPHKLYRRAFLNEHGIRFREGGRVVWEDILFNVKVDRYAKVISTLASTPYYHWHATPGSGSKGFVKSDPAFWDWLGEVLSDVEEDLSAPDHALHRRQLLAHQYRGRVLSSFDGKYADREQAAQDLIYERCRRLQQEHFPPEIDDDLNRFHRLRAELLRAGERDLLTRLPGHDPGIPGRGTATQLRWEQGVLHLDVAARWQTGAGRRHALIRRDERILLALPTEYDGHVPDSRRDMTDEIAAATVRIGLRSRASRVTWMAPSTSQVHVTGTADAVEFDLVGHARIDPETVVFGRPLEDGVWDLNARCTLGGTAQQQRLQSALAPQVSLAGARPYIAYSNADGILTVDVGQTLKTIARAARPDAAAASVTYPDGIAHVRVPLLGIETGPDGTWPTRVAVERTTAVRLLRRWWRTARTPKPERRSVDAGVEVAGGTVTLAFALPAGWQAATAEVGIDHPDTAGPLRVGKRRTLR